MALGQVKIKYTFDTYFFIASDISFATCFAFLQLYANKLS
jgi:hypothetical protein